MVGGWYPRIAFAKSSFNTTTGRRTITGQTIKETSHVSFYRAQTKQ